MVGLNRRVLYVGLIWIVCCLQWDLYSVRITSRSWRDLYVVLLAHIIRHIVQIRKIVLIELQEKVILLLPTKTTPKSSVSMYPSWYSKHVMFINKSWVTSHLSFRNLSPMQLNCYILAHDVPNIMAQRKRTLLRCAEGRKFRLLNLGLTVSSIMSRNARQVMKVKICRK